MGGGREERETSGSSRQTKSGSSQLAGKLLAYPLISITVMDRIIKDEVIANSHD